VAAFRLQRHHLVARKSSDLVVICRDICGLQAQVMGAAQLALWARADNLVPGDIHSALWEKHALVKTSAMRQTLHLLPAAEYRVYMTALRQSRMAALMRIMARIGVTRKEVDAMNAALMNALGKDPVPQRELAEAIKPLISGKRDRWMKLSWPGSNPTAMISWGFFRPAMIEGLICYGPPRGAEATFVRTDCWLPQTSPPEEDKAKTFLLRQYLGAYGPAKLGDFCGWSGIPTKEAKPVWESIQEELIEVAIEGVKAFILRRHLPELDASKLAGPVVRLLPSFDPYILANANKDHLVHPRHYKRVYRGQGWLSPVILLDGRAVGVWSYDREKGKSGVQTEFFEKVPKAILGEIKRESERLVQFK